MSTWVMPFNFAIYFAAVYTGNSSLSQYEDVSILIDGVRLNQDNGAPKNAKGTDMANHYIRGRKAIGSKKVSAMLALDEEQIIQRITSSGLYDRTIGAQCLIALLKSDHLRIDSSIRERMLSFPYEKAPERFLAQMLLQAIRCPQSEIQPLPKETVQEILEYRQDQTLIQPVKVSVPKQTQESTAKPPEMVTTDQSDLDLSCEVSASYSVQEVVYQKERTKLKNEYLVLSDAQPELELSEDERRQIADICRRADVTFKINYSGNLSGFVDVLLHRIKTKSASQIALLVCMRDELHLKPLISRLKDTTPHFLSDEGILSLAYGYDSSLPGNLYKIRIIYSLVGITEEEKVIWSLVTKEGTAKRNALAGYEGRVPKILLR